MTTSTDTRRAMNVRRTLAAADDAEHRADQAAADNDPVTARAHRNRAALLRGFVARWEGDR